MPRKTDEKRSNWIMCKDRLKARLEMKRRENKFFRLKISRRSYISKSRSHENKVDINIISIHGWCWCKDFFLRRVVNFHKSFSSNLFSWKKTRSRTLIRDQIRIFHYEFQFQMMPIKIWDRITWTCCDYILDCMTENTIHWVCMNRFLKEKD